MKLSLKGRKMRIMKSEAKIWNESYSGGGNIVFYPHEEIVRFINRYVRKRTGIEDFENVMKLSQTGWEEFRSLDLGCGIGRHVKLLDEFHLNPYGIDISSTAIEMGKEWFRRIGKKYLADKLEVGSITDMPYESESINIVVSHGVIDSMPTDIAETGIDEVFRILKSGGYFYFDVIMDTEDDEFEKDTIVGAGYEKGTTQSYWTVKRINKSLARYALIKDVKIISWEDADKNVFHKRAHIICCKKRE